MSDGIWFQQSGGVRVRAKRLACRGCSDGEMPGERHPHYYCVAQGDRAQPNGRGEEGQRGREGCSMTARSIVVTCSFSLQTLVAEADSDMRACRVVPPIHDVRS